MKLLVFIALFCFGFPLLAYTGEDLSAETEEKTDLRYSVSGHVKDASTGEALIGAAVIVEELNKGTVTNVYGFYSLSLPPGLYRLKFSYIGY